MGTKSSPADVDGQALTPRADQTDDAAGPEAPAEIQPGDLVVLGATVELIEKGKGVKRWTNDPDLLAEHGITPQFAIVVEPGKSVIHLGEPVAYELPVTRA